MKIFSSFFTISIRGLFIGFISIILLYISTIITWINSDMSIFLIFLVFGLLSGFINGIIVSIRNTKKNKIFSGIIGVFVTFFTLLLSLYINLPNILADYLIYGEDGGGLEPGGWFTFDFCLKFYFGISVFIGFPITMLILSKKLNNGVRPL